MTSTLLQPAEWLRPKCYANGIAARGTQVFISGQIDWDAHQRVANGDLGAQVRLALENIVRVLAGAGGRPEHVVRMTWYLASREEYLRELASIGTAYRAVMGRHFPVISVVQVVALMEADAKVETEATADLPNL